MFVVDPSMAPRRGELLTTLHQLDEEEDINKVLKYFSYEHFYVIYCKVHTLSRPPSSCFLLSLAPYPGIAFHSNMHNLIIIYYGSAYPHCRYFTLRSLSLYPGHDPVMMQLLSFIEDLVMRCSSGSWTQTTIFTSTRRTCYATATTPSPIASWTGYSLRCVYPMTFARMLAAPTGTSLTATTPSQQGACFTPLDGV